MPSTPKPKPRSPDDWRTALGLGAEITGTLTFWLLLGYLGDRYLELAPYGLLIGGLAGVVHIFWRLIRLGRRP